MTPVALRTVNDVSCFAGMKCSSIVFCILEVAPRNANEASNIVTIQQFMTF